MPTNHRQDRFGEHVAIGLTLGAGAGLIVGMLTTVGVAMGLALGAAVGLVTAAMLGNGR